MAPIGTLWGKSHQPQTKVILSVAALNDLELTVPEWHFFKRPDEYMSKFTYNKIPAFEGVDGFKLTEGATIARFLSALGTKANLLGFDAKETALIDQWLHFAEHEIGKFGYNYMCIIYCIYGSFNRELLDKQAERIFRALDHLETCLKTRPSGYLVTDFVTLADLVLAGIIYDCSLTALGETERRKYPSVFAHYAKVTGDERVKHIWEMEKFTEVAITKPTPFPYSRTCLSIYTSAAWKSEERARSTRLCKWPLSFCMCHRPRLHQPSEHLILPPFLPGHAFGSDIKSRIYTIFL